MNSATLDHGSLPASRQNANSAAASFWQAARVIVGVLFAARHHVEQVRAMQHLLRQSNRCESTNPARADALRQEAANLVD